MPNIYNSILFTSPPEIYKAPTGNNTVFVNLNPNEDYNSEAAKQFVYNVILDKAKTPGYDIKLSQGYEHPGADAALNQDNIELNFGSAIYNRTGIKPDAGYQDTLAFKILNVGTEWLDIKIDSDQTSVNSFVLEGPVVSPPEVADGAHLPVGKKGEIIATVKPRIAVNDYEEKLVLKGVKADQSTITRTITLKINVKQQKVGSTPTTNQAELTAFSPELLGVNTKTNSPTLMLKARAKASDIDKVKTVWYKITNSDIPITINAGLGDGAMPKEGTDAGWTAVDAKDSDGKYSYSYTVKNIPFPPTDDIYHIHWYIETFNTIGSRGVISSYDVNRQRPKPTITKTDGINSIGPAAFGIKVSFNPAFDATTTPLAEKMFSVRGGNIHPSTLQVVPGQEGKEYALTVQNTGTEDVRILFPADQVTDTYNNGNVADTATFKYSQNTPEADFSSIKPVYFENQASVAFSVSSGDGYAPKLYNSGGTLLASGSLSIIGVTKTGGSTFSPSVSYNDTNDKNIFTVGGTPGTFVPGVYQISIAKDVIKNYIGTGIVDTTYTFRVFNLSMGISDTVRFAAPEGYAPIPPHTVTITNTGDATVTGLDVVLTGRDDTCFVINKNAMALTLAGDQAKTTFTVAPRTGLVGDTTATGKIYIAQVVLKYQTEVIDKVDVKFTVKKLPPPEAVIDFENETLIHLKDGLYSINQGSPIRAEDNSVPISELWMNDQQSTNVQIDPITGAPSIPQPIIIPPRPEAPATIVKEDVSETGRNDGTIRGVNDSMEYKRDEPVNTTPVTTSSIALRAAEGWQDVPKGKKVLENLSPGTYLFRYKAIREKAFASKIFAVVINERSIPLIERKILMPPVAEGITSSHAPGEYIIRSGDDFVFTLTFPGTPQVVKTSRILEGVREVLTGAPNGTGGYTYTIRQVREKVTIQIGDGANSSNQSVTEMSVWVNDGHIYIYTPQEETVDIYTVAGVLFKRIESAAGAVTSISAASGVYMISPANGPAHKVIVQ